MIKTITILSTRELNQKHKKLFSSKLNILYKDFISIENLDSNLSIRDNDLLIFSSQNAVKSVSHRISKFDNKIACVGTKTANLIRKKFGITPIFISNSAKELANIIIKKKYNSATFLSGNIRRDDIPTILKSNNIDYEEITVYNTLFVEHHINENIDGILFYSPSGVESYLKMNTFSKNTLIFAIGKTTADFIKQKGGNCFTSKNTTIESLIDLVNSKYHK